MKYVLKYKIQPLQEGFKIIQEIENLGGKNEKSTTKCNKQKLRSKK